MNTAEGYEWISFSLKNWIVEEAIRPDEQIAPDGNLTELPLVTD